MSPTEEVKWQEGLVSGRKIIEMTSEYKLPIFVALQRGQSISKCDNSGTGYSS